MFWCQYIFDYTYKKRAKCRKILKKGDRKMAKIVKKMIGIGLGLAVAYYAYYLIRAAGIMKNGKWTKEGE